MQSREEKKAYLAEWRAKNPDAFKEWYAVNRERVLERKRRYYQANREKLVAESRVYRAANKERSKDRAAQWKAANEAAWKEYCRKWRAEHPNYNREYYANNRDLCLNHRHKRRARERGAGGRYTKRDILNLLEVQGGRCAACKVDIRESYTVDHVRPLFHLGTNDPENLQLLCGPCNSSKGRMLPEQWAAKLGKLFV